MDSSRRFAFLENPICLKTPLRTCSDIHFCEGHFMRSTIAVLLLTILAICSTMLLEQIAGVSAAEPTVPPADDANDAKVPACKTLPSLKLVRIPKGKFLMGSPEDEKNRHTDETQHEVDLTKDFYLSETEITREQFLAFVKESGYKWDVKKPDFQTSDDHPVVAVTWDNATAFCEWLSKKEGRTYRLPTEAEWEYACRGGTKSAYSTGTKLSSDDANFNKKHKGTRPVKSYQPNKFGLYDMHGNVWEWTSDWGDYYPNSRVTDPMGAQSGMYRMCRGGSWYDTSLFCRSAWRGWIMPWNRDYITGFRVAAVSSEQ